MARTVRGVRQTLPPGSLVGRISGSGAAQVVSLQDVADALNSSGMIVAPPAAAPSSGPSTLATLTDVNLASLTDKQYLRYDNGSGKWINVSHGDFDELTVTGANGSSFSVSEQGSSGHYFLDATATSYGSNTDNLSILFLLRARGTAASPTAVQTDDILGSVAGGGYGATKFIGSANIKFVATEAWTDTHNGTKTVFGSVANGATGDTDRFELSQDGGLIAMGVTGGSKGSGTINASGVYINGSLLVAPALGGTGLFGQIMSVTPTMANTGLSTWVNQGSSTTRDGATGLVISLPGVAGNTFRALAKSLAAPYTISALFCLTSQAQNFFGGGIGWVDTINSKAHVIALIRNGDAQVNVERWTTFSAIGSNDSSNGNNETALIWLQIQNDGTNITFRFSRDGDNWVDAHTETLAGSFMGATNYGKVCFFLNPSQQSGTGAACIGVLMSYKEA